MTVQEPAQVTIYRNLPHRFVSCLSTVEVLRVYSVEKYLASHSYVTFQSEVRDIFSDSLVVNKSTVSGLVNDFRGTAILSRDASNVRKMVDARIAERGGYFQHLS